MSKYSLHVIYWVTYSKFDANKFYNNQTKAMKMSTKTKYAGKEAEMLTEMFRGKAKIEFGKKLCQFTELFVN